MCEQLHSEVKSEKKIMVHEYHGSYEDKIISVESGGRVLIL